MTVNQQMFIYAVEEMSFTKAAEKGCVTQQCLSNHIHRLEESYGVKLFDRTPRLALTSAGEKLYRSLKQIQLIEENVRLDLSGENAASSGMIRLGIHASRGSFLFPNVFHEFHKLFPNVKVSVYEGQSGNMRDMLLNGDLDLVLGINAEPDPHLDKEYIAAESDYLLSSEELLEKCIPGWDPAGNTITAAEISLLPLTANPRVSTMSQMITNFMTERNAVQNIVCYVGSHHTQMQLCRNKETAFFSPCSFLLNDIPSVISPGNDGHIRILRVKDFEQHLSIELLSCRDRYQPPYLKVFRNMLREEYLRQLELLKETLPAF